jgi:NADPH:quinone reductase and related Zn-dependent oxidoreductases
MRAIVRRAYGETDVLRMEQLPDPEPGDGEVLVRVVAAGVNMAEWHLMSGRPTIARFAFGIPRPKDPRLGADVAGVVEKVGPGVTRLAVGDEVFGSALGAWAELAVAKERMLRPKPARLSFEEAAAVPMAGYTALQAVRLVGDLERTHVAVTGAGGGVGSYAVQLASAGGARVTAVCSARKAEFVRRLGAHDTIDYATTDPTAGEPRFDAVLDFAGGLPVRRWTRAMKPGGLLVLGGAENGGAVLGPLGRSLSALVVRGIRVVTLLAKESGDDLDALGALLASGELRPTLTQTYPFEEAARAVDDLRAARYPGKLVLVAG